MPRIALAPHDGAGYSGSPVERQLSVNLAAADAHYVGRSMRRMAPLALAERRIANARLATPGRVRQIAAAGSPTPGRLRRIDPANHGRGSIRHPADIGYRTVTNRYGKALSAGCASSMFAFVAQAIICWCNGRTATSRRMMLAASAIIRFRFV